VGVNPKGHGAEPGRLHPQTLHLSWRVGLTIVSIGVELSELTREVSGCWGHEDGNGLFMGA
jgi:hypothetical protein